MLSRRASVIAISVSLARRYRGSSDGAADHGFAVGAPIPVEMDTSSIQEFSKNGLLGRWTITRGRIVAVILAGLYFAGRGRVVAITCRDPILVRIVLLESSLAIEGIKLSSGEGVGIAKRLRWPGTHMGGLVPATICLHDIR